MAHLTPERPAPDRWVGLGVVAAIVLLAILRIVIGGWVPVAPDDARYLFVGLSIFDGDGPVNPNGTIFLLRSPVYGLLLATGSTLVGGDPLVGARIVAAALALLGLVAALRLGWLLAGPGGATGTAFALVATAIVWRLVPSLRIDLPQTAAILGALLAVWRPTTRRWALGGVLLGLAILVKETALPLLLLPVGLLGFVPPPRAARLAAVFVGAAVLTAAWWWVVVWVSTGQVFPLNALSVLETRDVAAPLRVGRTAVPLLVAAIVGWGLVAWRARKGRGPRLLVVAGLGLAPAALYAASLGLNARNYAGLAVLSAVAVGAAGASIVATLRNEMQAHPGSRRRTAAAIALAGVAVFALTSPVVGQRDAGRVAPDSLSDELAAWLSTNIPEDGRVVMAFREREAMALREFGRADVAVLPIARVDPAEPLDSYLWIGLRDQQLFGYRRAAWARALTEPAGDALVLVGPHPFTPFDLTADAAARKELGLDIVTTLHDGTDRAEIHRIDATEAAAGAMTASLHLSAAAAGAWLDQAGGDAAVDRFLASRPVVSGDDEAIGALLARLGSRGCATPAGDAAVRIGPAGSCLG